MRGRGPVCWQIRAVLLANVFCGILRCSAGILWCFAGVLRCFASVFQYFHKTHKTHGKHQKKLENTKNSQYEYARVMREFSKSKEIDCIAQNFFHKTSEKHRKTPPQNTAKQSQNAFCEITSQNTAKRTQNAQKRHKTLTIQPQYVLRAFIRCFLPKYARSVAKAYNTQYTRK